MEYGVLALVALATAAYIVWPRGETAAGAETEDLRARHVELLRELRDLDEDAAAGRISAEDRAAGRRALAPRLRALSEALRARGEDPEPVR
jgi:hypothetical protein